MKYSRSQHFEYLKLLTKVGEEWQTALGDLNKYRSSAGWRLLTGLWKSKSVKLTESYGFIYDLMSQNTQRTFVIGAINDGLIECDKPLDNDRRGSSSPNVWLSTDTRAKIDAFFDRAIDEMIRAANAVRSEQTLTHDISNAPSG